jgi:acetyl esterase/lipase
MASKSTYIFKTVDNLDLKLDIYTRESWSSSKVWNADQPVVLFFHGGGYVGYDRQHLPPHIVQSCLIRGWPLVSPDYRKLPQVKGEDILSDAKAAYDYVVENLLGHLTLGKSTLRMKNIVVVGESAGQWLLRSNIKCRANLPGGNLAILCGHYMEPPPIAILEYYGPGSVHDDFFRTGKVLGPAPIQHAAVEEFLNEPVSLGYTLPSALFNLDSLLPDLSRNFEVQPLAREPYPRMILFPWLVQENRFPELMGAVDKRLDEGRWMNFPPTVIVHGSDDRTIPVEASLKLIDVIGTYFSCPGTFVGRLVIFRC